MSWFKNLTSKSKFEKIKIPVLIIIIALTGSLLVWERLSFINHTQITDLAFSLLHGKFHLPEPIRYTSWQDSAFFNGKYYVYLGPLPALFLIPAVAVWGQNFPQQALIIFAGLVNFWLMFKLAQKFGLKKNDSLWLTTAFIFGSVYLFLSIVNISCYLVQIVGFTFLLAALYEFFHQKRWLLIGLFSALAGMSRYTLFCSGLFFLIELVRNENKNKKSAFFKLCLPIIGAIIILAFYNYQRFGNILDTGYTYNPTLPPGVKEASQENLFSLKHLPGNLFFLLFKGPEAVRKTQTNYLLKFPFLRASEWGMGIFFTSPFLLYLFLVSFKKRLDSSLLIASIVGIIPSLLYSGSGMWQYGYRYALDIYAFLFILLARFFKKKMPVLAKILIVYSILFNLFLMGSIWGVYVFGN